MITRHEAEALLIAPGMPLEITQVETYRGIEPVFAAAPPTLRGLYESAATDATFLVHRGDRESFAQTWERASTIATWLRTVGVQPGDRVAIAMRNLPEWVHTFMAATSMGAIAVAINALWEVDELDHALRDCRPHVLFVDTERLERIRRCSDAALDGVTVVVVRSGHAHHDAIAIDDALAGVVASGVAHDPQPDDPATIFYTSGSTGMPKGVLATHRQAVTAAVQRELTDAISAVLRGTDPAVARSSRSVALLTVPLFHVTASHAVFLPCFRTQCALVTMHKWDPEEGLRLIEAERVDWFIAPPAVTHDLVRAAAGSTRDLSSLKLVGGGGASRPPEQVRRIASTLTTAPSTGWGMTETSSLGTSISGDDYLQHPDSCGRGIPVMDLRVVGDDGEPLPTGEAGELHVRGTSLFVEYWNRPEATAEVMTTDGWFRTGDVARIDDEGYVYIVDRVKDLIIRGGENIGCGQVEAALMAHPQVHEAVVYGVPDERLGEEVAATVFASGELDVEALRDFVRPHLARFAVPRFITVTHEPLPRTASGKLAKRIVRDASVRPSDAPD